MINRPMGIKLIVTLSLLGGVLVVAHSSESQERTKKQNMIEMGEQFTALHGKIMTGAVTVKLTDQDFQEIESICDNLAHLAKEYAEIESDQEVASISTTMETTVTYLKQQATRKDPLVTVMTYSQVMSYCAECHYQTRWPAAPAETESSGQN